MTDYLWPVDIIPGSQEWRVVDNVGTFQSPLSGSVRTVARPGARMACTITVPPVKGATRARIMAVLANLRGRTNRIWMPDFSTTARGSMSVPELLTNNDFSGGTTTGWTPGSSGATPTLRVSDAVMRATFNDTGGNNYLYQDGTSVAYAPYVQRTSFGEGNIPTISKQAQAQDPSSGASALGATVLAGMSYAVMVPTTTTLRAIPWVPGVSKAGQYVDITYTSLSRCALVDNAPNLLLYSDQIDNAAWTKVAVTTTANVSADADGTTTADRMVETTATSTHGIVQAATCSSAAGDYVLQGEFSIGVGRNFVSLLMQEAAGSTLAYQFFNLSTGAVGTSGATGAGWSNRRAFITALGAGIYRCTMVVRKTSAATSISCYALIGSADGTDSYTGVSSNYINTRRIVHYQSSVPIRSAITTSAATSGTTQTGKSLYLKGLPASTNGLRKAGDTVQIGSQFNFLTADLDSNSAGLAYMQCGLPWRVSPADNDPVIFNTPMAKMILASDDIGWDTGPGQFSGFTLELIEDLA